MSYRQPLANYPDLVDDSGFGKPGSYLSSSLPDDEGHPIDCKCNSTSENKGAAGNNLGSHDYKEYVPSQENVTELTVAPQAQLLDRADLDWELDACKAVSGQNDYNINEELGLLEARILAQPVMVAESIGQRIKRAREQTRTADGDASILNCELKNSARKASEDDFLDDYTGDAVRLNTEQLEFMGDWPSESLEQRGQRSRKSASQTVKNPNEEMSNFEEHTTKFDRIFLGHFNSEIPNKTETLKLPPLLQGDNNQITPETTQDILPLDYDRHHSRLVTKTQPVLPDSALDWMSVKSSDPGKGSSYSPSPIKELGAKKGTKEACTDVHTAASGVMGLETGSEQKDKLNHNAYLPLSSGSEVEYSSESSQEKKKIPSRRAGKSCKLALTFTHQSPSSCPHAASPVTLLQQSEQNLSPELLFPIHPSAFAQTEPQDFALLWRIDQQKCSEPESDSYTRGVVILEGNSLRFVPKINRERSSEQQVIPYRVCHEKSSQVEENDLKELPFKQHSLEILSHHFKHVPKETLEDLYEKCHQDMEWITNLLLDSGEHLCRDDEENVFDHQDVKGFDLVQDAKEESCDCQVKGELFKTKMNCIRDTVVEKPGSNCCENPAIIVPNNTSSTMSIIDGEPEDSYGESIKLLKHQPDEPDQRESLECVPGPSIAIHLNEPVGENNAQKDSLQSEFEMDVLQPEVYEKYFDGRLKNEMEDRVTKEVNAIMISQLKDLECKEEQRKERENERKGQRKNGPMYIQTLELKLTTELALQLTELFGPVGISQGN